MEEKRKNHKKIRILSLDGGGIRGIITCVILKYIEELIQKKHPEAKLGDYFDLISGTSTGGLIACVLLVPDKKNSKTAKYSIDTALKLYAEKGGDIFKVSTWKKLINPFGLLNEEISVNSLEKQLTDFFGDLELKELIKPSLITSYDIYNRRAKLFNTLDGNELIGNFLVRDICRATAAAPTYFEPAKIKSFYGNEYDLIDGGVYANNPALCAYAEARKICFSKILNDDSKPDYPTANEMIIVSVGTGDVLKPYSYAKMKNAGKIGWVTPLIDILLSANVETVDYQCQQMFNTLGSRNRSHYYRINPGLMSASSDMDDASEINIKALIQAGFNYIQQNQIQLQTIADKLISND